VLVPLAAGDFDLDVDAIEAALGPRSSVVLISAPSNPAGRSYSGTALAALAATLRRAEQRYGRPITLIADETHRDFGEPGGLESAASHFDRTLIVYSFGKYHFLQGQRLGYVAVSPRHPERDRVAGELVDWTRITGIATPTSLMQRALPRLLELDHDQGAVASWRRRVVETLSGQGYEVARPDATLFVYVRTPAGREDFGFVEELARDGVLVLPAPVFHHSGHFRLALTGSYEMLERALPVFGRHAGG
jgi:aspartate aminotransferase